MEHPVALREGGGTYRWHAGAPDDETFARAFDELVERIDAQLPALGLDAVALDPVEPEARRGSLEGEPESGAGRATRVTDEYVVEAYGKALLELGAENDRTSSSSTPISPRTVASAPFELAYPDRFVECGIAEQDMVSTAAGLARQGLLPVVNSFAAFLASRANEQIYNQASEGTKVVYALHYAGLIPAGPGQVAPDRSATSRCSAALPNMTIVQPANGEQTARAPALGGRGRRGERRDPARDRAVSAADRAPGCVARRRRARRRAARGRRRDPASRTGR